MWVTDFLDNDKLGFGVRLRGRTERRVYKQNPVYHFYETKKSGILVRNTHLGRTSVVGDRRTKRRYLFLHPFYHPDPQPFSWSSR